MVMECIWWSKDKIFLFFLDSAMEVRNEISSVISNIAKGRYNYPWQLPALKSFKILTKYV